MLFCPPPPRRVVVPVTPGVNCVRLAKLRPAIGRFSTEAVAIVNDRSPLDAWMSGGLGGHVDGLGRAAGLERERRNRDAVAAADRDTGLTDGAEAVHRDFHGVGVGRDVREHEVARGVGDRGR